MVSKMSDLNPRVDIVFKKLFGVEENKDLLISLINAIVSEADQIEDVELLNPYNPRNFASDKLSILDVKAKRKSDGQRYSIEIQVSDEADYDKRALYYWGKLYTEQLSKGKFYNELRKAIAIHILNFTSIVKNRSYHNRFNIRDERENEVHFEDLELHTIELNKFPEYVGEGSKGNKNGDISGFVDKIKTSLDIWMAFLSKYELLDRNKLPKELNTEEVKKALEVVDVMNFSQEERDAYEGRLKWLRAEESALRKKFEEGIQKGREEAEKLKAQGIAKNLLSQGFEEEVVAKATGLSLEEVEKLKYETI